MTTTVEPFIVDQQWDLTYNHTADPVTAHFLRSLGEGKLLGIKCPVCERVLVPARPICDRDFCETEGWVELGTSGTLELFTVLNMKITGLPEPPYVLAYVKPDGANTAIAGFLEGLDLSSIEAAVAQLEVGKKAEIKFRDERHARSTDIYFTLAE